jgi:uncharacterized protein (DUF1778 family)
VKLMRENRKKMTMNKFPLRLIPSVRRVAEQFSQQEGISLNQFINVAVVEKLAHLQHDEWLARRARVTDASIAKAMEILDRPTKRAPEAGDALPQGYVSVRRKHSHNSRRA